MKNIIVACLLMLALPIYGQEYQDDYLRGKDFYKSGRYALAMESFKPLVKPGSENPLSKYAMFYYAVSAYKDNYPALAKNMFLQIQELYPQWEQLDEVRLWLAKIYLKDDSFNQALNTLKKINRRELEDEKEQLMSEALATIEDISFIKELHDQNSDNKAIAKRYAEIIAEQPLQTRDQKKLMSLVSEFDLEPDQFDAGVIKKSIKKDQYKVAVLLPFIYDNLDVSIRPKPNQFVLDMYHGIRMAVDSLNKSGAKIELYAYDTKREYNTTKGILQKEELRSMDLIIGPLYPEPLELVKEFAFRNKINMINPLSNNPSVIGNNPFAFLFKPSYATIGKALGEYARENVNHQRGIVIYGESESDSTLAYSYKKAFEENGKQIILIEEITAENPRRVLDILTVKGKKLKEAADPEKELTFTLAKDSIGSIFVASDESMIITRVLSGVETRPDTVMIIGSDKWLDIGAIDYASLERLGVAMSFPIYINYSRDIYKSFRDAYINRYRELPSEFAVIGYDLMMFAGNALKDYGNYFQLELKNQPAQEGYILTGYNYGQGNDNSIVSIVKVIGSEMQIVQVKNYDRDN